MFNKIEHETRLNKSIKKYLKPEEKKVTNSNKRKIDFDENAVLKDHFEAVIKCWRLMKPEYIDLCEKDLNDFHIEMMTTYLMNQ